MISGTLKKFPPDESAKHSLELRAGLQLGNNYAREATVGILRKLPLMHLARDSSVLVMLLVLETLSNLPLQKLAKHCSELVKDLTKHLPLLLKTLRDGNKDVRCRAIKILGQLV
jgi:hypothetical protein